MKISEWQNADTVPEVPGVYQRKITPIGTVNIGMFLDVRSKPPRSIIWIFRWRGVIE